MLGGPNFLTTPCDVLVPAALGGVINGPMAERLQCKVRTAWRGLQPAARGVACMHAAVLGTLQHAREQASCCAGGCVWCRRCLPAASHARTEARARARAPAPHHVAPAHSHSAARDSPCALHNHRQAIIEAANAPTTLEGDNVLRQRGIPVLPDVYANGGGAWHRGVRELMRTACLLLRACAARALPAWRQAVKITFVCFVC